MQQSDAEKRIEEEGGAKRTRRRRSLSFSLPRFRVRPFRIIVVLVILILILLFLIWRFGLGGGDGKGLPGQSGAIALQRSTPPETPREEPADTDDPPRQQAVRRELRISFLPSPSEPASAKALACQFDWMDEKGNKEFRLVEAGNMQDFEFALEKSIRSWRLSLDAFETEPVVSVRMAPFPGEGIFRKIEDSARTVDPRISILRLETPAP